ncbi:MAG: hypothetical protein ACJ8AF_00910 [Gemmatimonadaceae bacterium]
MLSRKLVFLAALSGAVILASCSDPVAPYADGSGGISDNRGSQPGLGSPTSGAGLDVRAVWWSRDHKNLQVSKTIGPSGGVISIPETGLTMSFPAGALTSTLTITVTPDEQYVAYKMEPAGTQFLKDVTVTQSLSATSLSGAPLRSQLYAAYIADDSVNLSGKVPVLEIEPSKTIFSPLSGLPDAQVWVIRHFSRYMLASG